MKCYPKKQMVFFKSAGRTEPKAGSFGALGFATYAQQLVAVSLSVPLYALLWGQGVTISITYQRGGCLQTAQSRMQPGFEANCEKHRSSPYSRSLPLSE